VYAVPRRTIWGIGFAITLLMLILAAVAPPFILQLRNAVFDTYQRVAPRAVDSALPIHVIDIDEASLAALGQWPWPRTYLAELTDRLFALGAVAVGFDILFSEPDRTSPAATLQSWQRFSDRAVSLPETLLSEDHDAKLADAFRNRPVVISLSGGLNGDVPQPKAGISFTGARPDSAITSFPGALSPLPGLAETAAGLGAISLSSGLDGVSRTVPMVVQMGDQLMPSLSAELLRVAQGAGSHILRTTEASGEMSGGTARVVDMRTGVATYPLDGNGHFRLHFSAAPARPMTPAYKVLGDGDLQALQPDIAGKIILVGSSAQGLFDLRTTPLGSQVPGVLLQAAVLEQVISESYLTRPDWMPGLELLLVGIVGLIVTLLCTLDRPLAATAGTALIAGVGAIAGWQAFVREGVLFDPSLPILTSLAILIPGTALGLIGKERMRQRIRSRFAYFVPEALVNQIASDPGNALTPQGAAREITVMFIDMRRFSTVTERMTPEEIVHFLNMYVGAVSDALIAEGATIDKYIGDAVMAFWNAPLTQTDHKAQALRAIFGVERSVAQANAVLEAEGLPSIGIGIGVNTGPAFVGLMGSRDRLSYTSVGDSVTRAARFEGLTRIYGTNNCVGAPSIADLPKDLKTLELDLVVVKGKTMPVALFTVYSTGNTGFAEAADVFEHARSAYLLQKWDAALTALDHFAGLKADGFDTPLLADLYRSRITELRDTDLGKDWDGTFVSKAKR
jgi:adenylate cyclase